VPSTIAVAIEKMRFMGVSWCGRRLRVRL